MWKMREELLSNHIEEMLSNTDAVATIDFLDKTCLTAVMEENGLVENPQFVPVST